MNINHEYFGEINFDEKHNFYEVKIDWQGQQISLSLHQPEKINETLKIAQTVHENQDLWNKKIREFLIANLYGETWSETEHDENFTEDEFCKKFELESLTVDILDRNNEIQVSFWFDDGDLFWGHTIVLNGNTEGLDNWDMMG
jgi:hypothetical protein